MTFKNSIIQITTNGMGHGNPELQLKLITTYLNLLLDTETTPNIITFYNEGVKLLVEGSPIIETLKKLESKNVRLIACGTCLNFYNLTEKLQVGIVGGMTDIIEAQQKADKVITL